jgi:ribonuclease D
MQAAPETLHLKTDVSVEKKRFDVFDGDLSEERLQHYMKKPVLAIDTETRGLNIHRDRLCLVQMCDAEGVLSIVKIKKGTDADNLRKLMASKNVVKLFHFARFDVAVMKHYLQVDVAPIWCTKIASKLVRTYTDRHSLKDVTRELMGIELDKTDQSSDWARDDLSESQMEYAANDVRNLIEIQRKLKMMLDREGLTDLAQKLFDFLPTVAQLDLGGWQNVFEH